MARYVVLSVDNNDKVDRLLGIIPQGVGIEVEGVFAKPTIFCPGSGKGGCSQGKRYHSWVQGQKYGWWVCAVCHKPSGVVHPEKRMRQVISQGTNLLALSQEETPPEGEAKTTGRENVLTVFDKEKW